MPEGWEEWIDLVSNQLSNGDFYVTDNYMRANIKGYSGLVGKDRVKPTASLTFAILMEGILFFIFRYYFHCISMHLLGVYQLKIFFNTIPKI